MVVIGNEKVEDDLAVIWRWVRSKDGEGAADRTILRIQDRFEAIGRIPGLGRPRDEVLPGCRGVPFGKHIIYYRVSRDAVHIVRVLDARRDPHRPGDSN